MRKLFPIILLLTLSASAIAQARKPIAPRLSVASRDFTVTNYGAVSDGQVATDCSMANGSNLLTCTSSHFAAEDVGKVIAVYGAGMFRVIYQQPLAATITTYYSGNQVGLSAVAQASVTNSERTVWGTNNTAAIQAAVDAAADAGGGDVQIPSGHYLTEGVKLPCSTIANTLYGNCIRAHNSISIRGNAALTTILENWNPDTSIGGMVELGKIAEIPGLGNPGWPQGRLKNIEIAELTLYQVKYPTIAIKVVNAYATEDVSIHDCQIFGYSYEGIYMGGGFKSVRWRVFNNVATEIGKGGPAYSNTTSAYNLNGSYVEAFNNRASNSGQCFEAGARHAFFYNNLCENTSAFNMIGFNIGSTGSGIWDVTIAGNTMKRQFYALVAGNGNGTIHDIRFLNNLLIDTPDVVWSQGGRNQNTVNEVETDSVIHNQSVISGNTFIFSDASLSNRSLFRIAQNPTFADYGSDTITISDNTATFAAPHVAPYLIVSGLGGYKWEPGRAFSLNAPAVSSMWGAYWYKATTAGTTSATEPAWPQSVRQTVADGGVTWLCMGPRPQVVFADNRATFPANVPTGGLYSAWSGAIRIDYGVREMLKVNNFIVNGPDYRIQVASPDMHEEIVPPNAPYSDTRRYAYSFGDAEPKASFWTIGTTVFKRGYDPVSSGWIVIRNGYAAPMYSISATYSAFGTFVKPTVDNGFIYQLISGSSTNAPEPNWPTVKGQTVTANGATWLCAANATKFKPL